MDSPIDYSLFVFLFKKSYSSLILGCVTTLLNFYHVYETHTNTESVTTVTTMSNHVWYQRPRCFRDVYRHEFFD